MERVKTFIQERLLPEEAEKLYQQGAKFEEIMMMYGCALREVQTKLEVLNDELSVRYNRNPIEFIKTRVKKPLSIVNKLQRRGLEVSIESMVENLNDVAGIRVICYFLDDIYDVARWLSSQDDIRLLPVGFFDIGADILRVLRRIPHPDRRYGAGNSDKIQHRNSSRSFSEGIIPYSSRFAKRI